MRKFRIECGVAAPSAPDAIAMNVHGTGKNVNLRIDCISRSMLANVPDLLLDLLEIAAYVYCADQRLHRGSAKLTNFGENWRRDLHFAIPVRDPAPWQQHEVQRLLEDTLGFLSDDSYSFEFHEATRPFQPRDVYFQDLIDASSDYDAVAMFSGGLDSFAGAVQDIVLRGRSLCLVGHSSATKVASIQQQLVDELKARGLGRRVTYIPVWVTNENVKPNDHSQRTRSFLFACLGVVIAHMSGKDRFIQVVSCNTHNLCALINTIALVDGEDNLEEGKFLCIRRSNDISQVKGFVPSPEVGKHGDPVFGTHHARDAYHLFRTRNLELNLWSSALKVNTQYMHCIHFSLKLKRAVTRDEIVGRIKADDRMSMTKKQSACEVFSFGRDHGYFGRILNQTVIAETSLEVRKGHEVVGFCFTPQDGNSLLSSFSAAGWFLDPTKYEERTQCLKPYFFSEV